jgi:hypothetical protein
MRRSKLVFAAGLVVMLMLGVIVWSRRPDRHGKNPGIGGGDLAGCMIVGNLALDGRDIYRDSPPGVNTWPPLFSLFCTIPALLARPTPYLARVVWIILNYVLVWRILRMTVQLVYGLPLAFWPDAPGLALFTAEVAVPFALCARFIIGNFDHLQVNVLIFALVLEGLVLHATKHDRFAGCCLGLASALKITPILFVPYFLFRRRYRVAASAIAVGAAVSVVPGFIYGWSRFADYLAVWMSTVSAGWGVGKMNQSAFAMLDRYFGQGFIVLSGKPTNTLVASGSPLTTAAWSSLAIVVAVAAARGFRGDEKPESLASLFEYSVVLLVSDLFGPVAWKAYFVNLLLPCMALFAAVRREAIPRSSRRVAIAGMALYALLAAIPLADFGLLGQRMDMFSAPAIGVLVILFLLLWLRPRVASASPSCA